MTRRSTSRSCMLVCTPWPSSSPQWGSRLCSILTTWRTNPTSTPCTVGWGCLWWWPLVCRWVTNWLFDQNSFLTSFSALCVCVCPLSALYVYVHMILWEYVCVHACDFVCVCVHSLLALYVHVHMILWEIVCVHAHDCVNVCVCALVCLHESFEWMCVCVCVCLFVGGGEVEGTFEHTCIVANNEFMCDIWTFCPAYLFTCNSHVNAVSVVAGFPCVPDPSGRCCDQAILHALSSFLGRHPSGSGRCHRTLGHHWKCCF